MCTTSKINGRNLKASNYVSTTDSDRCLPNVRLSDTFVTSMIPRLRKDPYMSFTSNEILSYWIKFIIHIVKNYSLIILMSLNLLNRQYQIHFWLWVLNKTNKNILNYPWSKTRKKMTMIHYENYIPDWHLNQCINKYPTKLTLCKENR
jgi:hypothetical protein